MERVTIVLTLFFLLCIAKATDTTVRSKRHVVFPPGSAMGLYLALSLPLDLPKYEISMSFNYEANYDLPSNVTEITLGPQYTEIRKARDLTRRKVYSYIEKQMERQGMNNACLLKTICETQANPIEGHNGLIGDLIHILFTPSSTASEDMSSKYSEAEKIGKDESENCAKVYFDCPIDIYDFFTVWSH